MTTYTPENKCLFCGYLMDAATGHNPEDVPDENSVSICIRCGAVTMFTKDLKLRPFTEAEAAQLRADPEAMRALSELVDGRFLFLYSQVREPD